MNKNNTYFLLDSENNILSESKTGAYMYQDFLKNKNFEMAGYLPVVRDDEKVTVTVPLNTLNVDNNEYKIVCTE